MGIGCLWEGPGRPVLGARVPEMANGGRDSGGKASDGRAVRSPLAPPVLRRDRRLPGIHMDAGQRGDGRHGGRSPEEPMPGVRGSERGGRISTRTERPWPHAGHRSTGSPVRASYRVVRSSGGGGAVARASGTLRVGEIERGPVVELMSLLQDFPGSPIGVEGTGTHMLPVAVDPPQDGFRRHPEPSGYVTMRARPKPLTATALTAPAPTQRAGGAHCS